MFKVNDTVVVERKFVAPTEPRFVYGTVTYMHPEYGWSACNLGKYIHATWNDSIYSIDEFRRKFPNAIAVHI